MTTAELRANQRPRAKVKSRKAMDKVLNPPAKKTKEAKLIPARDMFRAYMQQHATTTTNISNNSWKNMNITSTAGIQYQPASWTGTISGNITSGTTYNNSWTTVPNTTWVTPEMRKAAVTSLTGAQLRAMGFINEDTHKGIITYADPVWADTPGDVTETSSSPTDSE